MKGCGRLRVFFVLCCWFVVKSYGQIDRVTIDEFLTGDTRNVKTLDPPKSGHVYAIFEGQSNRIRKMFEVTSSGVVTVRGPLVYTRGEANEYDVIVVQRPIGAKTGGEAKTLRISVRDRNNFSPTFPKSIYYGFIQEGSPENTVVQGIGDCYAEDRDQLGIDRYSIVFGNEKGYFKIETRNLGTGNDNSRKFLVLKTTSTPIVRDPASPNILLTVRAVDRTTSGDSVRDEETKILITIEDQNNNDPVFPDIPEVTISENTQIMTTVLTVRASDKDDGRNGGVYYYLNPLSDYFSVDPITGAIRVVRVLNAETKSRFDLTVFASDRGRNPRKGSKNFRIIVDNVPDYPPSYPTNVKPNSPPTFPDGPYNFKVREDFPAKAAVLIIRAVDRDREKLTYSLVGGSGDFSLNPLSGVLTLERPLDYESGRKVYNMEVEVRDSSGTPVKTKLVIEVQDVDENYNNPVFDENTIQKVARVQESKSIGSSVITVTATDADVTGIDGQIAYSVTGGTGVGVFGIDSSTGAVTTLTPLNRDLMSSYKLIINATDKAVFPRTTSMFLIIDVADVDFNFPEFTKPMYVASVPEKMPPGTFVTAVEAIDKDGQKVSYELSDINFRIESTTGVIRTAKPLDASSISSFQLDVIARTSGPERVSHAQVNVTVTTEENAPPKFKESSYTVKLPENQEGVSNLLCIAATDNNDAPVEYAITSGANSRIKLDPDNGQLATTGSFNYEAEPRVGLRVSAKKKSGSASQSSPPITVDINIQEEIDAPKFQKDSYVVEVDEDLRLSTTVANGFVIQDDDTPPDKFKCSMVNILTEAALLTFNVIQNGDACKLVTLRALDYSIANEFRFDVRATDKNFVYMYATTSVKVIVKDKNNHSPVFSQTNYWTSVSSNTVAGQSILTVAAEDKDFDKNAVITYSLVSSVDSSRFSLDGNSGVLKAAASLEKNKKYQLQVAAKDSGDPKRESAVTVWVSVYDTAVDSIRFTNKPCQATLNENVGRRASVLTVRSTGPGSAEYKIVGGDSEERFTISPSSGLVTTNKDLDYEQTKVYKLAVRAKYKATPEMADDLICTVTIRDVDDQIPRFAFQSDPEPVTVESYTVAGTNIIKALAFDPDSKSVTYEIDTSASSSSLPFTVDSVSGQVTATKKIEFSKGSSYVIVLKAKDSADHVATAKVAVTVIDMPKPPEFPSSRYTASVREVDRPGDTVRSIAATYSDPNNADPFLKYSFVSGNVDKAFCINRDGLITIARPLDREKVPKYTLRVMVEKGRWNDTADVDVNIQDINDRAPQFTPYRYEKELPEDFGTDREILRVTANDKDGGSNGQVTYSLLQPVDKRSEDVFEVKNTGAVVLKGGLDFEQLREHILFIKAKDGGSQSLSSVTEVRVKVKNVNDNFPVFSAKKYRAKVALDTPVKSKIIQLSATDQDYAGTNKQDFNFTIIEGNNEDAFEINHDNGLITLKKSLATVSATRFELKVTVSDGEKLSKVPAIVELNVYLPDGPPKFSEPRVIVNVKEGIPANGKVALVRAATSEALTYTILEGNVNNMFKIGSSSGAVLATRTLDAEERKKYELLIRAQDTRDRSAQVTVVINVENINDNAPTIPDEVNNNLDRRVIGEKVIDDVVTSLEAYDKDGDSITYKINAAAEKYFYVDSKGLLRAKRALDDFGSTYLLTVTVEDNGSPPLKKEAKVRLVFVQYRPDQQPVRVDVSEDIRPGTKLARVPRVFPGGKLSLVFPKDSNFTIDSDGWIKSLESLDYEQKRFYSLTSQEVDSKGRKNNVDIEITVLDVNDNGPEFKLASTFASVNKNARSGAEVYRLSAIDKDSGSSGIVGFQIVSKTQPFVINPFTQVVETADRFDHAKYNWTVRAFDFGIPRRMSDAVSIDITTTRIPPRFTKSSYSFKVDEHSPTGTSIGRVLAASDSGLRIGYKIVEGNSGDKFRIDSQGQIFVNYILDFEKDPTVYNLKVRATELIPEKEALKSDVDVKIELENVNDNVPKFESLLYEKAVLENVSPGTSVLKVSAKDCDCSRNCVCSLGQLKYSLTDEFFAIDADSGIIRTKKELDYEKRKLHIFQVFVTDFGKNRKPYKEMCVVEVTVGNSNDNAPEFLQRDYNILVSESATQGKALAAFQARDLDGDEVTYSIGSGISPFEVERKTGILKLTGTIPSDRTQYTLRIRAEDQDGKHDSDARVVIKIEDTNNHRPKFTNCNSGQVIVKVEENQPSLKIFQVKATDEDRGRNGEIEYGLEQWTGSLFKIDNTTGEIRTTAMLDREKDLEKKSFKLFVWAQDGGHGSIPAERLISYCTVQVDKKDQNDNYPIFLTRTYDGSVYNGASIGTSILSVSASDEDDGLNKKVQYTMQQSVYFEINSDSGVITTKADLSRITVALTETLTVTASNKEPMVGAPVQPPESKTNVQITISPNKPPKFQKPSYTASVKEDVPLNKPVVTVKAEAQQNDPATGKPYPVIYNLIKANRIAAESFKISSDGEISTAGTLNYESTKVFRLQVRAVVDGQDNRLYATASVEITIEDVNDDSPTFVVSNYKARVLENEALGIEVITVEAEDLDTGAGGQVEYFLSDKNENKDHFSISQSTGTITTKTSFDRETKKSYYVPFDAKDKGPIKQYSSNSYALVTVVDQNDNKPMFNQSVYERTVKEDSRIGFSIMEVVAKDKDIGENARLDYFITGVEGAVFEMKTIVKPRNYGLLTVEQPLDYESKNEYTFQVIATDRKDSATATIKIKISDANDNAPVFKRHAYEFRMNEETSPGVPVLKVTATDIDTSQVQQSKLTYSLDKDGLKYFAIDAKTGQITTSNTKIDREVSSVYFFTVKAFDGVNTGTARVKVLITDINDNAPEFPNKPYIGYIMEGKKVGSSVLVIQAIDKDDPKVSGNTEITYSLDNNADGRFEIEPDSGLIKTLKVFDRETTPNTFIVVVRGTDKGNPKLSGTTEAKIIVLDDNDHAPVLTQTKYNANVPEDALPGYSVARVLVTDQDEGPNAEFEFVIVDGSDPYRFYIDPRNGTVFVSGMLDFETQKSYLLNITVRDRGMPEKMASERAYVFINIEDTNDNAPEFIPKEYNITVSENINKGTEFLTVTAKDADSTTNSDLSFSITGGNEDDLFDIKTSPKNAKQGIIFTIESLDREAIPYFELETTVADGGGLKGKGIVRVTLQDVNDNGPHFVPAWYEAKIKENLNAKQRVTRLSAYDPDVKSNGAPFVFSIVNGTRGNNFRLEEPTNVTSTMYSFGPFDREKVPEWKLGVRALDSGKPKMSNFTYVYVDVGDENDNEPFPGSTTILVNVYNKKNPGSFSGGVIGKPYYRDEDYDGDVNEYTMAKNTNFRVNLQSGDIQMQPGTPLGSYEFKVKITESTKGKKRNGPNFPKTVTSSVTVIVRSVSDSDRKNSFAIQFLDMRKVGYFVVDYYYRFVSVMQSVFGVGADNVIIFSIQKPKEETRVPATNVVLAIRKSGGGHFLVAEAVTKIFENKAAIERLGLKIGSIGIDQCAKENQKVGRCRNEVLAFSNFTVASGDIGRVPAPSASTTIVSVFVELAAVYESIVEPIGNCTPNPCLNGGTCHINRAVGDISKGYVCECPDNYRGPECQLTTRTFYGNSYIWLPKLDAYENSKIELEMSTKKPNGLLLYQGPVTEGGNNGLKDFMAIVLAEGRIRIHISLGRTAVVLSMTKGPKLDDGEWHIIQVFRQLKVITIIIDKCEKAQVVSEGGKLVEDTGNCLFQGSVKGQSVYLNGFGPLQIGGTENDLNYPKIPYTKFEGCIRNIKDNGRMYDLANPLKVVNAPVGCQLANKCPDCNGNGYCEPLWNVPSICVCHLGYSGTFCNARAKASYYLANSFTQYIVKSSKKRRELVPPPVPLKNEYYTNIALQVKVDANSSDCIVFLSTNSLGTEFNRIDVKNHILRYTFRLGNRMKTLKIPQLNITDGKYHSVVVRREGNRASLQIDFDGKVEGNTGGSQRLLNIGGGSFFSGGLPNITVVQVVEAIVASGGNAIIRNPQGQVIASGTGIGTSTSSFRLITVGNSGNVFVSPTVVGNPIQYFVRAYTEYKEDGNYVNHIGHHTHSKAEYTYLYNLNRGKSSNGFSASSGYFTSSSDGVAAGGPIKNRGVIKSDTGTDAGAGGSGSAGTGTAVGSVSDTTLTGVAVTQSATIGKYGTPIQHVLPASAGTGTATGSGTSTGAAAGSDAPLSVIGDFGGCTAAQSFNGVDLESDPTIEARRQNVVNGCPCEAEFCLHGGTCVNAVPSYCICPPGWEGTRCEVVSKAPNPGTRPATMFANPGVIAVVLVVLLAIVFIIGAVLLKRRPAPVAEVLVDDGHVHDNIRVYHDDGAGEEDNFGYDINQLMKYTYVENGGIGVGEGEALVGSGAGKGGGGRYGAGEAEITRAEEKPLLTSGSDNQGMQHGVTTITRRRVIHPDSIDVGRFIDTRVIEANREYTLALDSIHIYKYEGDDSDVDDLSELGDSGDEDDDDDQDFQFLQDWGSKFDKLNRIFNEE